MTFKVAVFGEALFDMIEQENGDYRPFIGGSPYNVARSFSRQGLNCSYLSPISNDSFGDKIYNSATIENIHMPQNNRSFQATSLALVYKNEQGNPDYRLYRKSVADLDISADRLLSNLPEDLDLFHTGSLALVPEMLDVLIPVMTALKSKGVKISIDVNVRKGVEIDHAKYVSAIAQLITYADIVKVSDEDLLLQDLVGDPEELASNMLKDMTNGMVVLTLGENGAHIITENINIKQAVYKAIPMGDTVGAGDTFFSSMLAQLLRDNALTPAAEKEHLAYALKYGSLAASINVSKIGCQPPTHAEVLSKLDELGCA
jgi:fructokinase